MDMNDCPNSSGTKKQNKKNNNKQMQHTSKPRQKATRLKDDICINFHMSSDIFVPESKHQLAVNKK